MSNPFFEHPILNSPYACPSRHWELDDRHAGGLVEESRLRWARAGGRHRIIPTLNTSSEPMSR